MQHQVAQFDRVFQAGQELRIRGRKVLGILTILAA
jgi:hypothetical protein